MTHKGNGTLSPSISHPSIPKQSGGAGGETLNIQLHRLPQPLDAWVWHISGGEVFHELDAEQLALLKQEGWQLLDPKDATFPFLPLISQLADTLPVILTSPNGVKTLARSEAIQAAQQFPVVLAFAHQDIPPVLPGPPAQLGELGIIFDDEQKPLTYRLTHLGEEGLLLSQQLKEALSVFLSSGAEEQERASAWLSAQVYARHLAQCYWEFHQQALDSSDDTLAMLPGENESVALSTRRVRKRIAPATSFSEKEPVGVPIPISPITQALMHSLLDGSTYTQYEELGYAEHTPSQQKQNVQITIRPGSGEEWDNVLQTLKTLGDEVVDTFCALLAIAIDMNGEEHLTNSFFLDVDDILLVCQRQKSHGTYTTLQRLRIVEHLRTLGRVHITASEPDLDPSSNPAVMKLGRKKRRSAIKGGVTRTFDSTVMDLLGTMYGEYLTLTGEALWERREVKLGRWAQVAPLLSRETAQLLRRVLAYHARRQRQEKRIGRWLTLQFQTPAGRRAGYIECSTQTLLEQSGIRVNLNIPGEIRVGIEEAIEQLLSDNIITSYERVIVVNRPRSRNVSPFDYMLEDDPPEVGDAEPGSADYFKAVRQHIHIADAEGREIRTRILQRARQWWPLYTEHVWWRFEPPFYERRQLPREKQIFQIEQE